MASDKKMLSEAENMRGYLNVLKENDGRPGDDGNYSNVLKPSDSTGNPDDDIKSIEDHASAEEVAEFVENSTVESLVQELSGNPASNLWPSRWRRKYMDVPYPGKLAEAVNRTPDAEPTSDLFNFFYHGNGTLSREAKRKFFNAILDDERATREFWADNGDMLPNGAREFAQKHANAMKIILMVLEPSEAKVYAKQLKKHIR